MWTSWFLAIKPSAVTSIETWAWCRYLIDARYRVMAIEWDR